MALSSSSWIFGKTSSALKNWHESVYLKICKNACSILFTLILILLSIWIGHPFHRGSALQSKAKQVIKLLVDEKFIKEQRRRAQTVSKGILGFGSQSLAKTEIVRPEFQKCNTHSGAFRRSDGVSDQEPASLIPQRISSSVKFLIISNISVLIWLKHSLFQLVCNHDFVTSLMQQSEGLICFCAEVCSRWGAPQSTDGQRQHRLEPVWRLSFVIIFGQLQWLFANWGGLGATITRHFGCSRRFGCSQYKSRDGASKHCLQQLLQSTASSSTGRLQSGIPEELITSDTFALCPRLDSHVNRMLIYDSLNTACVHLTTDWFLIYHLLKKCYEWSCGGDLKLTQLLSFISVHDAISWTLDIYTCAVRMIQ